MKKKTIIGLSIGAGIVTVLAAAVAGFIVHTHKELDKLCFDNLCD